MRMKKPAAKPKLPRGRGSNRPDSGDLSQATAKDFEREGMGVAPKE